VSNTVRFAVADVPCYPGPYLSIYGERNDDPQNRGLRWESTIFKSLPCLDLSRRQEDVFIEEMADGGVQMKLPWWAHRSHIRSNFDLTLRLQYAKMAAARQKGEETACWWRADGEGGQ